MSAVPMSEKDVQKYKSYTAKRGQWRKALLRMMEHIEQGLPPPKRCIDLLAFNFIMQCLGPFELANYKELADRLDGKPAQEIEVRDDDSSASKIERIVRQIVQPDAQQQPVQPRTLQ